MKNKLGFGNDYDMIQKWGCAKKRKKERNHVEEVKMIPDLRWLRGNLRNHGRYIWARLKEKYRGSKALKY